MLQPAVGGGAAGGVDDVHCIAAGDELRCPPLKLAVAASGLQQRRGGEEDAAQAVRLRTGQVSPPHEAKGQPSCRRSVHLTLVWARGDNREVALDRARVQNLARSCTAAVFMRVRRLQLVSRRLCAPGMKQRALYCRAAISGTLE